MHVGNKNKMLFKKKESKDKKLSGLKNRAVGNLKT